MKKTLIAYCTWSGTTHQVADEIGKVLIENEINVDITPAKNIKDIKDYQAVILGTSIHAGQTTRDFNRFLNRFHKDLIHKNVAYFVVCLNMIEDNEKNYSETYGWLNKTISKYSGIQPISVGLFGGAVITNTEEFNRLNILVKKVIESMKKGMENNKGTSEFRNWEKIRAWSKNLLNSI